MAYLDKTNVFEAYRKSVTYMKSVFDPLDEHERLAKNLPREDIPKGYPRVTDGTTASIVKKTPRRVIQQIPTGRVISPTNDWLSIVASYIYLNEIIPNANDQYELIQKCWLMVDRAMTFGASHSNCPVVHNGDYIGPGMSVPYIKNVYFEAGKVSDIDSNCMFVDAWYQPADIDAIIKKEKELAESAKQRGEVYESTWDLKELAAVKDQVQAKTSQEKSAHETNDNSSRDGIKLVHALQTGVGAEFYTIHPNTQTVVRTKVNKDPRGVMPVHTMYFEVDGINPLGRGLVEMVAPLQNLMDAEMQMYQYNRALMLNPPLVKRGNWNKTQAQFTPNKIIDIGLDPNASIDALKIDSTSITNFPANYGLMKSQLLNMASSPDTSISATVGNPGFSKTDAGVNAVQANVSIDDNYIRKQFEAWFQRWSETAINLYFAERTGVQEIQVDEDTALKLRKIDPSLVDDNNMVVIDFDTATEALKFEVDASTSNMKNDAQQLEALDGLLERMQSSPLLQQTIPQDKIIGAWNSIVAASGVENPEDLTVDIQEWQQEQEQLAMQEQAMRQQAMSNDRALLEATMQQGTPTEMQLPAEPTEQVLSQDDLAFITALQDMGYPDEKIQQALAMDQFGLSNEEIIDMLEATSG